MKLLFSFSFIVVFSLVLNAQTDRNNIKQEFNSINNQFQKEDSELQSKYLTKYKTLFKKEKNQRKRMILDSLYQIDFQKYNAELQPVRNRKIESYKTLLQKVNDGNSLVGKTIIYRKDNLEDIKKVSEAREHPENEYFEFIGINSQEETDFLINKDNIQTIRKDFMSFFDTSLFDETSESLLSANLTFILDIDGVLKKIRVADGDEEFAYTCALSLYLMNKKYEPSSYKGKSVLSKYRLPIKMAFEY